MSDGCEKRDCPQGTRIGVLESGLVSVGARIVALEQSLWGNGRPGVRSLAERNEGRVMRIEAELQEQRLARRETRVGVIVGLLLLLANLAVTWIRG